MHARSVILLGIKFIKTKKTKKHIQNNLLNWKVVLCWLQPMQPHTLAQIQKALINTNTSVTDTNRTTKPFSCHALISSPPAEGQRLRPVEHRGAKTIWELRQHLPNIILSLIWQAEKYIDNINTLLHYLSLAVPPNVSCSSLFELFVFKITWSQIMDQGTWLFLSHLS